MDELRVSKQKNECKLVEQIADRLMRYWYNEDHLRLILLAGTSKQKLQLHQADVLYHSLNLSLHYGQRKRAVRYLMVFNHLCCQIFDKTAMDQAYKLLAQRMDSDS